MFKRIITSLSRKKNPYHEQEMKRLEDEKSSNKTKEEEELDKIFARRIADKEEGHSDKDILNDVFISSLSGEILDNVTIENGRNNRFDMSSKRFRKNDPNIPAFDDHKDILDNEESTEMPDGISIPKKLNPIGGAELLIDEEIENSIINLKNDSNYMQNSNKTDSKRPSENIIDKNEHEDDNYEIVIKDKKKFYKRNGKRITLNDRILTLREKKSLLKREKELQRKEKIIEKNYDKAQKDKDTLKTLLEENTQLKKNLLNEEKIIFEKIKELDKKNEDIESQRLRFEKFAEKIIKEKEQLHHKEEDLFTRESELGDNVSMMNSQIEDIINKQKEMKTIQLELLKKIKEIDVREKEISKNYAHSENTKKKEIEKLEKIDDMHNGLKEKQIIISKRAKEIQKGKDIKETIDKLYQSYEQIREKIKDEYKKLEEVRKVTSNLGNDNIKDGYTKFDEIRKLPSNIGNDNIKETYKNNEERIHPISSFRNESTKEKSHNNNTENASIQNIKKLIEEGMIHAKQMNLHASKNSLNNAIIMYKNIPVDVSKYIKKEIYNDILILKHEIESRI